MIAVALKETCFSDGTYGPFKGKTAFVTGGASGIGLALCRAFGQRGINVAIADVEAKLTSTRKSVWLVSLDI